MEKQIYLNKNIVLIGMPGAGKTTIGREISKILNVPFIDSDEYIEKIGGKPIPDIFAEGEEYFRDIETKAIKDIAKGSSMVISTGGGVVKRGENMEALRKSSIIIFINRPVDLIMKDIEISSRPLLKEDPEALHRLYRERIDLYRSYSDFEFDNSGDVKDIVNKIISLLKVGVL